MVFHVLMAHRFRALGLLFVGTMSLLQGCGGSGGPALPGAGDPGASGGDQDVGCPRTPASPDRERYVVISHPYDDGGGQSSRFEVLALSKAGHLSVTGKTFNLGRIAFGDIVFTPDGALGFAAQDDGSLGVFRLAADGTPAVIHSAFSGRGDFYAQRVVVTPNGGALVVVDGNTPENGGGLYLIRIACDGSLDEVGKIAGARTPGDAIFVPGAGDHLVVAGKEVLGTAAGADAYLLQGLASTQLVGQADVFADDDQLVEDVAVTADGRYALIADASIWSGLPHRVAAVEVVGDQLRLAQTLSPLLYEFPAAIAMSPFNNAFLLLTAEAGADALVAYGYDPTDAATPFALAGELSYQGAAPEMPTAASVIAAGGLKGRVFIAENLGVRQAQFLVSGAVVDLGKTSSGSGLGAIVGAIGVQP
ncbi:MAG: hypothetical protein HY903_06280 [Deltaproteobacteria bacterium]|nr:hypothetical protein [Deltaproteobacteria bacterium]